MANKQHLLRIYRPVFEALDRLKLPAGMTKTEWLNLTLARPLGKDCLERVKRIKRGEK